MGTLNIRISNEEKELLKQYSKLNNISISEFLKQSALEKIDKEIDLLFYKEAIEILAKEEPTVSFDKAITELGLSDDL